MLDTTTGLQDFVGRHRGITHEHHFIIVGILVQHIDQRNTLLVATDIITPHRLVNKIVEVKVLDMLEFATGSRE